MSFLKRTAFSVAEYLTPVLTTSQFYKTGQITPEEFLQSGNQLVSKCPSWQWGSGAGDAVKDYLPKDKQYLYTKGVVSTQRAATIFNAVQETEDNQDGDNWVVATNNAGGAAADGKAGDAAKAPEEEEDDEVMDLDDMDYGDLGEEDDEQTPAATGAATTTPAAAGANAVRTYDISIVYDKLYRSPRVYLQGYDSTGKPLTEQELQLDISGDHMNKTVTWEIFPYTQTPCMSVHPCQHAHTMKRMLEIMVFEEKELIEAEQKRLMEKDSEEKDKNNVLSAMKNNTASPKPEQAKPMDEREATEEAWRRVQQRMSIDQCLFLFLKFIATVIPTINYDNTINFDIF